MSWSVSATGKSEAVATKLESDFAAIKYLQGDEAAIKDAAAQLIIAAVGMQSAGTGVQVEATGSASVQGEMKTQSIMIRVQPIWGYCG